MPAPVTSSQSGLVLASWHVGEGRSSCNKGGMGSLAFPALWMGIPLWGTLGPNLPGRVLQRQCDLWAPWSAAAKAL